MNLRSTRAVVSRVIRMSGSSKLVWLISEDYGLLKVMAKGARRPKSIFGAALEPVTLISCLYHFRETREIQNLSSAEILEDYPRLKTDITAYATAAAMVEIAGLHTAPDDPGANTFDLVTRSLQSLDTADPKDAEKHLWRFVLRLLSATGYRPRLDACISCGKKPKGGDVFFSFPDGGIVCDCSHTGDTFGFRVSPGSLMAMQTLAEGGSDALHRLKIGPRQKREIGDVMLKFLQYHSGSSRMPRSLAFLKKLEAG